MGILPEPRLSNPVCQPLSQSKHGASRAGRPPVSLSLRPVVTVPSGVHKGGFSKGGFSNNSIMITHKLFLNPPLLNPPL